MSLFERLMTCETLEHLYALADATPEEELLALTDEENERISARIEVLEPEPLPPVEEEFLGIVVDETVTSEDFCPTINFDYVAPFVTSFEE